jgi:hypothetical protein
MENRKWSVGGCPFFHVAYPHMCVRIYVWFLADHGVGPGLEDALVIIIK